MRGNSRHSHFETQDVKQSLFMRGIYGCNSTSIVMATDCKSRINPQPPQVVADFNIRFYIRWNCDGIVDTLHKFSMICIMRMTKIIISLLKSCERNLKHCSTSCLACQIVINLPRPTYIQPTRRDEVTSFYKK